MDVNRKENSAISAKYNISGYPTLLYFENGELQYPYPGENNKQVRYPCFHLWSIFIWVLITGCRPPPPPLREGRQVEII
jgi:hypothetical protein